MEGCILGHYCESSWSGVEEKNKEETAKLKRVGVSKTVVKKLPPSVSFIYLYEIMYKRKFQKRIYNI